MDRNEVVTETSKNQDVAVGSTKMEIAHRPQSLEIPPTLELKQNGYLALSNRWESGVYDSPGFPSSLTSQASGAFDSAFDYLGRPSMNHIAAAAAAAMGDDIRGFRQSSIDSEPQTLPVISVRQAQDGAVEIIEAYDQEEAVHLFLKDAEDESLREEALAAVLPTSEFGVS